ncbi:hypothetical protein AK812_SmicGene5617 [Symbiodinium microadriaticum]|uniref:Uncharacterized protein n=1 Tax=Symbiodinium microadriaticum TaxID=2951 RepID=A0A1Q9ET99_SYMMI|nr:hypothetical protein AK812_SmicGene5617 [Symbiodinium microadriaticum]
MLAEHWGGLDKAGGAIIFPNHKSRPMERQQSLMHDTLMRFPLKACGNVTLKAPLNGALEELRAPVEAVSQSVYEVTLRVRARPGAEAVSDVVRVLRATGKGLLFYLELFEFCFEHLGSMQDKDMALLVYEAAGNEGEAWGGNRKDLGLSVGSYLRQVDAWVKVTRSEELALLDSVGNDCNTTTLQMAAVLMTWGKATYLTGDEVDEGDEGKQDDDDESMPEEEVVVLHEAYVVQETTKAKYREVAKASGVDPRVVQDNRPCIKDNKQALEDRVS